MIYAIPHSRDSVANHFMKAKQFAFFNEDNSLIQNVINPGAGGNTSCSDKKAAMTLIKEMNADAVIVRNIGERALGKLLSAGIRVFKLTAQTPVSLAVKSPMVELTDASQGRPSKNHIKKGGCGGHHQEPKIGQANSEAQAGKTRAMLGTVNAISSISSINK